MPRATVTFNDGSTGTYNVPANATPEQLAKARRRALGTDYDRPDLIDKPSYVVTRPEEFEQQIDPSTGRIIGGLGVETSISIGSQVLGAMTGPFYFPITFLGGAGGSITAQKIEGRGWDDIHWGRVVSAGVLTMVPGSSAAKGAKGLARIAKPLATEAARGAGYGVTDATIRAYIDEGRAPTGKELLTYGTIGAGFGTALKGAGRAISKKSGFANPSEVVDNLQLVAGRLSNFKETPFVEKNELIKNLRLNSDDGEPLGLVADDLIAAGQVNDTILPDRRIILHIILF